MKIFNTASNVLIKKSLTLLTRHHQNIAENISRMNDPDYLRKPTRFLDELTRVETATRLRTSSQRHIVPDARDGHVPDWEKGKVQLTREMADLAQNQIRYDFSSRIMRRRFEGLLRSITGRTS